MLKENLGYFSNLWRNNKQTFDYFKIKFFFFVKDLFAGVLYTKSNKINAIHIIRWFTKLYIIMKFSSGNYILTLSSVLTLN